MSALRDNQAGLLTRDATVGRRAFRWSPTELGFGPPATIEAVSDAGLDLVFEDGSRLRCQPTEVMVSAVTQRMLDAGASALFLSYPRQADPEKAKQQMETAEKHARIVLEAAVEGRTA